MRMAPSTPQQPPAICLRGLKPTVSLLLIFVFFNSFCSLQAQNVIEYLPGFPDKLPFKLETGYIGVGEDEEMQFFYYFTPSENNPKDDPLILWLTGGPGCTGLYAVMYEIGPLTFDYAHSNGSLPALALNKYSWTKVANIIYIDQPAGAGFCYANTSGAYNLSDTSSASLTYEFLRKWLISHPEYIENPLYISGDSYSGITVPLVVNEVYNGIEAKSTPLINIKGYTLGNPLTDALADTNEYIPYAHRMGLLSDKLYKSAKVNCQGNYNKVDTKNVLCLYDLQKIKQCLEKINEFMIIEPWCVVSLKEKQGVLSWYLPSDEEIHINFLQSVVAPKIKTWCRKYAYSLISSWANDKSVQKALQIRKGTITKWVSCNSSLTFENSAEHNGVSPYIFDVPSAMPYHQNLKGKSCRTLIYSGDHDMGIPHIATEKWIDSLKLLILSDWRPWYVEDQVAGYTMTYGYGDYNLTYATIKGAGHTVPEYKPIESLAMISRWLEQSYL